MNIIYEKELEFNKGTWVYAYPLGKRVHGVSRYGMGSVRPLKKPTVIKNFGALLKYLQKLGLSDSMTKSRWGTNTWNSLTTTAIRIRNLNRGKYWYNTYSNDADATLFEKETSRARKIKEQRNENKTAK